MGLYQLIFSVYLFASTLAVGGITTAVTRLVANEAARGAGRQRLHAILIRALFISLLFGIASALLLYFGASAAGLYWLRDARAPLSLQILAPSLPFISVSACLRGYFMARRNAASPSNSQILEQAVRMAIIIVLIDRTLSLGLTYTCAAVVLGNTVSEIVSCAYMYFGYRRDLKKLTEDEAGKRPMPKIISRLMTIAMPIAIDRYLNTALHTVENLLVPNCLEKYSSSRERALSEIGMLRGMAMPILFFPSSFLSAMSTLLVPEISEAAALGKKELLNRTINRALHVTITSSILIGGVFTAFAYEFGTLIYKSTEVGFLIRVLAPLAPLMYLESIVDGLLKGLNQQVSSLKYGLIDSTLRICLILLIVPGVGMRGFLFVMIVSNVNRRTALCQPADKGDRHKIQLESLGFAARRVCLYRGFGRAVVCEICVFIAPHDFHHRHRRDPLRIVLRRIFVSHRLHHEGYHPAGPQKTVKRYNTPQIRPDTLNI